jgi:hypothetical protein
MRSASPRGGDRKATAARILLALAALTAGCGGPDGRRAGTRSIALPAPELIEPAFEPHLSIDPDDPDRIVVAAHYGVGYNRGGRKIWTWRTGDGGRSWTGSEMPLPAADAALAADAVTGFGLDGSAYLTFLFADTAGRRFNGGAALTRDAAGTSSFGPAGIVARGGLDSPAGAAVDKGWLAIDRGARSPHRGTVYLTWHLNRPDFATGAVHSSFWLAASRDGGNRFSAPVRVADAFHGQVAVRSDGTVDVIFSPRGGTTLLHAVSDDGGHSFSVPDTVVDFGDSVTVDVPHLLATGGGRLLVCWSQATAPDTTRYDARCARSSTRSRWDPPSPVVPSLPRSSSIAYPVTAGGGDAVWLLAYRADADTTRVILFRSGDGGRSFDGGRELARRLPGGQPLCVAASAPCRRDSGAFFPGDYFGLAATPSRLAAAYVLPDTATPDGRPTVYVSIVHPERAAR